MYKETYLSLGNMLHKEEKDAVCIEQYNSNLLLQLVLLLLLPFLDMLHIF